MSYTLPLLIFAMFLLILVLTGLLAMCFYRRFKGQRASSLSQDALDDEQQALLGRSRSTSYYDTNRSRAPAAVMIHHDTRGRPLSTWSTASSVAAQRGEELTQWSRRRDDLLKIYGRGTLSSLGDEDDLDEEPEQEQEEEQGEPHGTRGTGERVV